jgi:hypothetical protein
MTAGIYASSGSIARNHNSQHETNSSRCWVCARHGVPPSIVQQTDLGRLPLLPGRTALAKKLRMVQLKGLGADDQPYFFSIDCFVFVDLRNRKDYLSQTLYRKKIDFSN